MYYVVNILAAVGLPLVCNLHFTVSICILLPVRRN